MQFSPTASSKWWRNKRFRCQYWWVRNKSALRSIFWITAVVHVWPRRSSSGGGLASGGWLRVLSHPVHCIVTSHPVYCIARYTPILCIALHCILAPCPLHCILSCIVMHTVTPAFSSMHWNAHQSSTGHLTARTPQIKTYYNYDGVGMVSFSCFLIPSRPAGRRPARA